MTVLPLMAMAAAPGLYLAYELQSHLRIMTARKRGEELRRAFELAKAHYDRGVADAVAHLEATKMQYYRDGFDEGRRFERAQTITEIEAFLSAKRGSLTEKAG